MYLLVNIFGQNLAEIDAPVLDVIIHTRRPIKLCQKSTKKEVHNIQRNAAKERPQSACTKKLKYSQVVFEICEQTDIHADVHAHHNTFHPSLGESHRVRMK